MQVRKMFVAVGVIALAVAGCGSEGQQPAGEPEAKKDGIVVKVGEAATAPMNSQDTATGETTKVEVTTASVNKGTIDDLKDFQLNAQTKASEPYYVTMTFRNVGDKPAYLAGIYGVIRAHNPGGDQLTELTLNTSTLGKAEFDKCGGENPPKSLEVGAEYTNCTIYLAPSGQTFGKVVLGFSAGKYPDLETGEITWNAG